LTNKVTCIICPKSCIIEAKKEDDGITLAGDSCSRGKKYAIVEITDPRRIFTSTVLISGANLKVVPVRTTKPIKKNDWVNAKKIIDKLKLDAPLEFGRIIVSDFLEKGIDLIITREILQDNN